MTKKLEVQLRFCSLGHKYFKSSDCPTCPICEAESKPEKGFQKEIAAPARRALKSKGIESLKQLSKYTEAEILDLHGMGKASILKLRRALKIAGLNFKKD